MKIVITGANRGIGLELARQYLARGDSVAPLQVTESAAGLISVMDRLTLQESGGFFSFRGERIPW